MTVDITISRNGNHEAQDAEQSSGLSTPVRRRGREKLAERTIETVLQLTPDTETVAATLRAAGLRFSRKANPARPAALASNDMGPARQDLVTRKIVSLNAWKSVGR
jgi:hypothetical protein